MLSAAWSAAAAVCLITCGPASAQLFGGGSGPNTRAQAAYDGWRRLSQNEIDCVIEKLRGQRSSLQAVIQRGIGPSDSAMAPLRAACRTGTRPTSSASATTNQQRPAPSATQPAPNAAQALAAVDSRADEAARKVAAERRAAELAAEKALAEKVAAEVAAVRKAAAEKVAAERAAAQMAAAEKAVADRIAAEQTAAQKATEEKAAADKKAADEAAAKKAQTEKSTVVAAKAEQPAQEVAQPQDEHAHDTPRISTEAANALAQARLSFLYGLISGPLIFCLGGVAFMLAGRRRGAASSDPFDPFGELKPAGPHKAAGPAAREDLDSMVRAVMLELERRKGRPSDPLASPRASRVEDAGLH